MNKHRACEFLVGLLFGLGLIVSGMNDPGKVVGFLDLFGAWDPSLAFVMAGAILLGAFAFAAAKKRTSTLLGTALRVPQGGDIDSQLIAGSVVFGVGWGLAGFCPAPAFVSLGSGNFKAVVFVLAMLAGMALYELLEAARGGNTAEAQ